MKRKVCQSYVKTRKTGDINPYNSSKIRDCLKIYTISPEYLTEAVLYPPPCSGAVLMNRKYNSKAEQIAF